MSPSPSPARTISIVGDFPHWISASLAKHMRELITDTLTQAGITSGSIALRFSTEKHCLKRKHLTADSVHLRPGYTLAKTSLVVTAVGPNPRNDICDVKVTLSPENCALLKAHLSKLPNPVLPGSTTDVPSGAAQPVCRPVPTPAIAIPPVEEDVEEHPDPKFDADSIALYLSNLQECGSRITVETAMTIALRSTGDKSIFIEARDARYIFEESGCCQLTGKGHDLLQRLTAAPDATKPAAPSGPSEFDRLKAAVIAARQHHQQLKEQHDAASRQRAALSQEIAIAKDAQETAAADLLSLRQRLEKLQQELAMAQTHHSGCRCRLLDLENEHRRLENPSHQTALIQAERTLKEAEAAYQALIAL